MHRFTIGYLMSSRTRTDWLKELQIGIGLVIAVIAVVSLLRLLAPLVSAEPAVMVSVPMSAAESDSPVVMVDSEASERVGLAPDGSVELAVGDPTVGEYLLSALTWLPGAAVGLAVAVMAYLLVRRSRAADPFTLETVRRLRAIGAVALAGGVLAGVVAIVANFTLSSSALTNGNAGAWNFPWGWLLGSVAVFAIADIMKRGNRMREDLDGVI